MSTKVEVPSVGESVTEAILLTWHKKPGEKVSIDEPLCELETDKANVDIPSPGEGYLKILAQEGDTVQVGQAIASLEASGDGLAQPDAAAGKEDKKPEESSAPAASSAPASSAAPASSSNSADLSSLRPSVRRLVQEHGLDPKDIPSTGPGGQLTKDDVDRYLANQKAAPAAPAEKPAPKAEAKSAAPARPQVGPRGGTRREPMSKIRRRIATRLVAAQQETAMLTTFNEVDLSAVKALRASYKEKFKETHGIGLGFMSFFSKAASLALMEFPYVNAFIEGDEVVFHDYVNLGIAVSTERGLVVPVVKDVDQLSMDQIESEIKRVAGAARDGKLGLDEMSGGTFTLTNGGVFGSMMSTPILNRPQSAILGMHAILDRPVAVNGQVEIRPMMYLAMSYDHRIIDGKDSVRFLYRIKEYLEDPARMLLKV